MPFRSSVSLVAALALGALACGTGAVRGAWQLVWNDEFSQPDGSSPDSTKWGYDIGNGSSGWGNNEREYYTSRTNNARIQNGQLVIEARNESYNGYNYTSARLLTKGKWSWAYGRIEANIKLPRGQGIWPAFWMLGTNIDSVGWPTCGETDIMENIGKTSDQGTAHGTIHGPQSGGDYNGGAGVGGTYTLPGGAALADNFHLFAVEWTTNQIKWFVDTNLYFTATPASLPSGGTWVFTQPQFLVLNLAVGGNWPGYPDGTTVFPQQMLVDYVRVYKYVAAPPDTPTGLTASPGNGKVFLSWNASTNGATGYNVKRSLVSGGSYTSVVTGLTTTNYTDTSLTNGTTYYYVVSAVSAGCESTNSTQVTATPVCAPPPAPTAANNGPVYECMTLNLSASTVPGATYSWTGPNGFTSASQNPSIARVTTNASGTYTVMATIGSCTSVPATTSVRVNPLPILCIQQCSTNIMLTWPDGVLQSATNITGPWEDVPGACAPYTNCTDQPQQFHRLRLPQ
jgi:beta-glucanase (GH16 family)